MVERPETRSTNETFESKDFPIYLTLKLTTGKKGKTVVLLLRQRS